jgi:hypothetical protein
MRTQLIARINGDVLAQDPLEARRVNRGCIVCRAPIGRQQLVARPDRVMFSSEERMGEIDAMRRAPK